METRIIRRTDVLFCLCRCAVGDDKGADPVRLCAEGNISSLRKCYRSCILGRTYSEKPAGFGGAYFRWNSDFEVVFQLYGHNQPTQR